MERMLPSPFQPTKDQNSERSDQETEDEHQLRHCQPPLLPNRGREPLEASGLGHSRVADRSRGRPLTPTRATKCLCLRHHLVLAADHPPTGRGAGVAHPDLNVTGVDPDQDSRPARRLTENATTRATTFHDNLPLGKRRRGRNPTPVRPPALRRPSSPPRPRPPTACRGCGARTRGRPPGPPSRERPSP